MTIAYGFLAFYGLVIVLLIVCKMSVWYLNRKLRRLHAKLAIMEAEHIVEMEYLELCLDNPDLDE